MMKETGRLVVGVTVDGVVHRDFALRAALVRDSVEIMEEGNERAMNSDHYMGVCMFARRLASLGSLPREAITPDLLMGMHEVDMAEIYKADRRLAVREATFRSENETDTAADPGGDEAGDIPPGRDGHAGVGDVGVA